MPPKAAKPTTIKISDDDTELVVGHMYDKTCLLCGDTTHDGWDEEKKCVWNKKAGAVFLASTWAFKNTKKATLPATHIKGLVINWRKHGKAKWEEKTQGVSKADPPLAVLPAPTSDILPINPAEFHQKIATTDLFKIQDAEKDELVETSFPALKPNTDKKSLKAGNTYVSKDFLSSARNTPYAIRKEFSDSKTHVLANYFEVRFKPDTHFFIYEIPDIPESMSRRKVKLTMKAAIEGWDFLKNNKDHFATDYLKTIVAWKPLHESISTTNGSNPRDRSNDGMMWAPKPIADGEDRLHLHFKYHGEYNLPMLQAYVNPATRPDDQDLPHFDFLPIVDALNIAISKGFAENAFKTSANRFFLKDTFKVLTDDSRRCKAMGTLRGYEYTIKPGMGSVFLNIQKVTSAFFNTLPVSEFMADGTFDADDRKKVLKGKRVYIAYDRLRAKTPLDQDHVDRLNKPENRVKVIFDVGDRSGRVPVRVKDLKFKKMVQSKSGNWVESDKFTTVAEHMKDVFGKTVNGELEAVNVGSKDDPSWYPQELLTILPYQMHNRLLPDHVVEGMHKEARKGPEESRTLIEVEALQSFRMTPGDKEQELPGCPQLLIKPTMLRVPATHLPPLMIKYGTGQIQPHDQKASWNLRGNYQFLECPKQKQFEKTKSAASKLKYILVNGRGAGKENDDTTRIYAELFEEQIKKYGIGPGAQAIGTVNVSFDKSANHAALKTAFSNAFQPAMKGHKPDLVLLLLPASDIPVYSAFKDVMERQFGLHSICMTEKPNVSRGVLKPKESISNYIANVAMKVNLKTGGRNHTVGEPRGLGTTVNRISDQLKDTLVLGADVTHPGGNSLLGCPSIASVVGSVDPDAAKFLGSMRLQKECKKEIIDDMQAMVVERIRAYFKHRKTEPKSILFFRDGVSTSQYASVVAVELAAIRDACKVALKDLGLDKVVPITALVAVKRHSTRFYSDTNGDCKPGTLVDRAITSPYYSEFYLQSHRNLEGTAIPTRYFVLENGMKLQDKELQMLTHKLCYTYVRATMGVSYAPPAYYADRLCERGRCYMRDWFNPVNTSEHYLNYMAERRKLENARDNQFREYIASLSLSADAPQKGRGRPRKSAQQIMEERSHEKATLVKIESDFLKQAKREWGAGKDLCGPWKKELDDTMFWM